MCDLNNNGPCSDVSVHSTCVHYLVNLTVAHIEEHVFPGWDVAGLAGSYGDFCGQFLPRVVNVRDVGWSGVQQYPGGWVEWDPSALAVRREIASRVDCAAVRGSFLSVLERYGWREHSALRHLVEPLAVRRLLLSNDLFYGRVLYRLFW